ncbi:hypothetical protein D3C78_960050 [compost metagenome]
MPGRGENVIILAGLIIHSSHESFDITVSRINGHEACFQLRTIIKLRSDGGFGGPLCVHVQRRIDPQPSMLQLAFFKAQLMHNNISDVIPKIRGFIIASALLRGLKGQ